MSEKRFSDIWCSETGHIGVTDYGIDKEFTSTEFEDLLNKQQALINALKKENKELKEELKKGFDVPLPYVEYGMRRLRAEHKVDEQQAEIDYLKDMITAMKLDIKNAMQMVSRWNDE